MKHNIYNNKIHNTKHREGRGWGDGLPLYAAAIKVSGGLFLWEYIFI